MTRRTVGDGDVRSEGPIFIIGTERSGSNLLRLILNSHPDLAIPHPPHLMRYLAPLGHTYGDLRADGPRRALTRDALTIVHRHLVPWEHEIDAEAVVQTASPSVFGVVAAIYEQYRASAGKPRFGCKSTFMVAHVDDVVEDYPSARFVWLVRDPRDVAASAKESVFGPSEPCLAAELWDRQQALAAQAQDHLGMAAVHLLRYEDLVADPQRSVCELARFLEITPTESMLEFHTTPPAQDISRRARSWSRLAEPISASAVGRHAAALDARERGEVEAVAAPMMRRLGYAPIEGDPRPLRPRPVILARSGIRRLAIEWRALRYDANAKRRLVRDLSVCSIRARAFWRTHARWKPRSAEHR